MTGGIIFSGKQGVTISSVKPGKDNISGYSSVFFSEELNGEPRRENLFYIRILGQTTYVEMMKDIVKNQVASTKFKVKPVEEVEEPSEELKELAEKATEFFKGKYNTDRSSWVDLMNITLDDTLDFDSGIWEKVPDDEGFLKMIIPRDGLTFTIKRLDNGLLPAPESGEPAYYQFSKSAFSFNQQREVGIDLNDFREQIYLMPNLRYRAEEIPFSRDQIVWFTENPVSYSSYGRGRTQKIKKVAEIVMNGDIHRNKFFLDNEFHKGFIHVAQASQPQLKNLKEVFQRNKGNEYQIPVVGGSEANWISMDPSPDKMQFLESHKWYTTVVIMAYGLNEAEAGLHENANLAVSDEMKYNVWRRTTRPLLKMFEDKINSEVLPYMREYHSANGLLTFEFEKENDFLTKMQQEIDGKDLDMGVVTINDIRRRRGEELFGELGELPKFVLEPLASQNPGWVAERMNDNITDAPTPMPPTLSIGTSDNSVNSDSEKKKTSSLKKEFPNCYKELLENASYYKEALRNENGGYPGLKSIIEEFAKEVSGKISDLKKTVLKEAEKIYPEDPSDKPLINSLSFVDNLEVEGLSDTIEEYSKQGLEKGADYHKTRIESELEKTLDLPIEAKASLNIDVLNTFTAMALADNAMKSATEINNTVRASIKLSLLKGLEKGRSLREMSLEISEKFDDISRNHSDLIARTEVISASRKGSQALAESTDLIAGKEWIATGDSRTRPWHAAMNGVIVDKKKDFVVPSGWQGKPYYQPSNYPKSARVVGEDQPFNCRCDQSPVLREDMPATRDFPDYNLELKGLTIRQVEVWQEHNNGETSFEEFWKNVRERLSVRKATRELNMSPNTIKIWDNQVLQEK